MLRRVLRCSRRGALTLSTFDASSRAFFFQAPFVLPGGGRKKLERPQRVVGYFDQAARSAGPISDRVGAPTVTRSELSGFLGAWISQANRWSGWVRGLDCDPHSVPGGLCSGPVEFAIYDHRGSRQRDRGTRRQPGQNVAVGEQLLTIVPLDSQNIWGTANFKETQLKHMPSGQPVRISVDAYGHTYKGHVLNVAGATGSLFSTLAT